MRDGLLYYLKNIIILKNLFKYYQRNALLSIYAVGKQPVYILVEAIQKLPPKVHKTSAGNILLHDLKVSL